jgi:hypothetical protein
VLDEVVAWVDVPGAVEVEAGVDEAGVADASALEGSVASEPTSLSTTGAFANGSFAFAVCCEAEATWAC